MWEFILRGQQRFEHEAGHTQLEHLLPVPYTLVWWSVLLRLVGEILTYSASQQDAERDSLEVFRRSLLGILRLFMSLYSSSK